MTIYRCEGLRKTYRLGNGEVNALAAIHFQLEEGQMAALVGPSGSGKSTLLNLLGLMEPADEGLLEFCGRDLVGVGEGETTRLRRRQIGFIFQSFNLVPVLTALENVEYPLLLEAEVPAREVRERAREALRQVGLECHERHKPAQLSGGQRQRVAIARALVKGPRVILADEPTANLDSQNSRAILELLNRLREASGTSVVVATHDREVAGLADRQVCLKDGRVV